MAATLLPASNDPRAAGLLRAAFRDVHGPRLHAFALLLALGDRETAGEAAGRALAAGMARADQLRHPERAAAWLRGRVLRELRRSGPQRPLGVEDRDSALSDLLAGPASIDALAQLHLEQRAALIAGAIERLDLTDVATVLDLKLGATRQLLRSARMHYLAAATAGMRGVPATELTAGVLSRRVDEAAAWTFGRPQPQGNHD